MNPDRFKPLLDREFLKAELRYEFFDDLEKHRRIDRELSVRGWG